MQDLSDPGKTPAADAKKILEPRTVTGRHRHFSVGVIGRAHRLGRLLTWLGVAGGSRFANPPLKSFKIHTYKTASANFFISHTYQSDWERPT